MASRRRLGARPPTPACCSCAPRTPTPVDRPLRPRCSGGPAGGRARGRVPSAWPRTRRRTCLARTSQSRLQVATALNSESYIHSSGSFIGQGPSFLYAAGLSSGFFSCVWGLWANVSAAAPRSVQRRSAVKVDAAARSRKMHGRQTESDLLSSAER